MAVDREQRRDGGRAGADDRHDAARGDRGRRGRRRCARGNDEIPIRVRLASGDRATVDDVLEPVDLDAERARRARRLSRRSSAAKGRTVIDREDRERQIAVWAAPLDRPLRRARRRDERGLREDQDAARRERPPGRPGAADERVERLDGLRARARRHLHLHRARVAVRELHPPAHDHAHLPLAFVGAIVALFLAHNTISMGSMIGIILLMGLVTKNAILLLDRAIVRVREHGETPLQAILEAGPERLRPMLMTSAAMILGMLPTALSRGEGASSARRWPSASSAASSARRCSSLIVVPAFYLGIEGAKAWLRGVGARRASPATCHFRQRLASDANRPILRAMTTRASLASPSSRPSPRASRRRSSTRPRRRSTPARARAPTSPAIRSACIATRSSTRRGARCSSTA